jgi:hypothetical protein
MLALLGLSACGTPVFGSGMEGSGSSADGDFDIGDDAGESDDGGAPPRADTQGGGGGGGGDDGEGESGGEVDDDGTDGGGDDAPAPTDDHDGPTTHCACTPVETFRNLWVPNPAAGTVSKIDAASLATTAIYDTSATAGDRPNATAVSIDGRAVVVGNSHGGATKIWTDPTLCDGQQNTLSGVQTASGGTALPYGTDECVAWSIDTDLQDQRPIAWGPGERDPISCEYEHQVVWIAGCQQIAGTAGGDSMVLRIDGDTGHVIEGFSLSEFPCATGPVSFGAVDRDGSFWVASGDPDHARVAEIAADGTVVQILQPPLVPSGLAIDSEGHVWLSSRYGSGAATAARFDSDTLAWDLAQNQVVRGDSAIAQGPDGMMWVAYEQHEIVAGAGGVTIDPAQLHVGGPLPQVCGGGACTAMTIDLDGRVWTFSERDGLIYRYDPVAAQLAVLSHGDIPAVASDMTGLALQNAACDGL